MKKLTILFIIQIIVTTNLVYSQGEMIYEKKNLRGQHARDIEEDGNGNIWILSSLGGTKADDAVLCQYKTNNEWYYFKDYKEIYGQKFYDLNLENNNIMACYHKKGVYIFDGSSWKNLTKKTIIEEFNISKKETIHKIRRDSMNRTWVETKKGLLLCENNNHKRYLEDISFFHDNTFFSNGHVYSASGVYQFIDDEFIKINDTGYENLRFVGTDNQNRNWYTSGFFKLILAGNAYRAFAEKGDLLFTVSYFVNNTWKNFEFDLPYGHPLRAPKLYFQPDSSVWICSGGFIGNMKDDVLEELLLDDIEIRDFLKEEKIIKSRNTNMNDMLMDSKGNLWLTTGDPGKALILKIVSAEEIEVFKPTKHFPASIFTYIVEDSQNRIWFGTTFNGIYRYEYNE